MKQLVKTWLRIGTMAAAAAALMLLGAAPKAKAQDSSITGTLTDLDGKPWPGQTLTLESEQGTKSETKTEDRGLVGSTVTAGTLDGPNHPGQWREAFRSAHPRAFELAVIARHAIGDPGKHSWSSVFE